MNLPAFLRTPAARRATRIALWGAVALLFLQTLLELRFFTDDRFARGLRYLPEFLAGFFPPNLSDPVVQELMTGLKETIQMAFVGTLLGAILAVPMAVLATRTLAGTVVSQAVRLLLAFVRTIPTLIWALFFVVLFSFGPIPGVLGLAVYTLGYLGKLYYETLEGLDPDVLEAVRATGASRLQLVRFAAIPEAANALLSHLLYVFEYNVRASSILGFVGAGGIGFYMARYLDHMQYQKLTTAILFLLVVVVAIDLTSRFVRKRFLLAPEAAGGNG